MEPVVCSFQTEVDAKALAGQELGEALSRYLDSVVSALKGSGCRLIGHIKLMFDGGAGGCLMASATSFDEAPSLKGRLEEGVGRGSLTVHAVVYGVGSEILEGILKGSLGDFIPTRF